MVDRYTKTVLTVIAACLLWLCAFTVGRPAQAQQLTPLGLPPGVQPVVIVGSGSVDESGKISLRLVGDNGPRRTDPTMTIRSDNPLAVKLPYSPLDPLPARVTTAVENPLAVSISAITRSGTWDAVRTQVEPASTRDRPGGGR